MSNRPNPIAFLFRPRRPGLMLPPGPGIGQLLQNRFQLTGGSGTLSMFSGLRKQYGDLVYIDFLVRRLYLVFHPDHIRHILADNQGNYVKSSPYEEAKILLGNGLLNSEGDFWRKQRKLAQGAFSRSTIASFLPQMRRSTNRLVEGWQSKARLRQSVPVHAEMMELTLDIIAMTMFHMDLRSKAAGIRDSLNFSNEFASTRIRNTFNLPLLLPVPEHLNAMKHLGRLNRIVYGIIEKRRNSGEKQNDLLQSLLDARSETGQSMDDRSLRDELMTIFLAGHETTAVALTMMLHCLAMNPEWQEKIHAEVSSLSEQDCEDPEKLTALPVLTMIMEESLRLYPPAWIMGRKALKEDEIGGYRIRPGVDISMPIYAIHRDPRFWEKPEEFHPEHFLPEKVSGRPRHAYIPFGAGPRMCIGKGFAMLEMQIVLTILIRRFRVEPISRGPVGLMPYFTLRPEKEIHLRLSERG